MARTNNLSNFLTDIANAIRSKKGTSETIPAEDFDTEIENLPSGGGDLDEYFVTEITENTSSSNSQHFRYNYQLIKKYPEIKVANNVTQLTSAFQQFDGDRIPKIIFGNNVTEINSMFYSASKITTIDVSGFDTSNVTGMNSVFNGCSNLVNLNLSNFDTKKVTGMAYMFYNCTNLTSVDLSSFDTSSIQSMQAMFSNCKKLTSLDLSNFNTFETVTNKNNTTQMFQDCLTLAHIDMRNFKFNFINSSMYNNMFGSSASTGVPDDCEIIVADDTAKTWINTNFSRLTNVKTVAEYEAEQNA